MKKLYEIHGIPDNPWLEYDAPPDYVILFEADTENSSFFVPFGLAPGDLRLWGALNYWTVLEAALLLAGASLDDPELYAAEQLNVTDEGYGDKLFTWKYAPSFHHAKEYLFLLKRSDLAPKASPVEWVKYFHSIVDKIYIGTGSKNSRTDVKNDYFRGGVWFDFFHRELNETNQVEILIDSQEKQSRREIQHEIILAVIAALNYEKMQIPDGGKAKIKKACLTRPGLFTDASFEHAWKAGVRKRYFRLANHEKFTPKK